MKLPCVEALGVHLGFLPLHNLLSSFSCYMSQQFAVAVLHRSFTSAESLKAAVKPWSTVAVYCLNNSALLPHAATSAGLPLQCQRFKVGSAGETSKLGLKICQIPLTLLHSSTLSCGARFHSNGHCTIIVNFIPSLLSLQPSLRCPSQLRSARPLFVVPDSSLSKFLFCFLSESS